MDDAMIKIDRISFGYKKGEELFKNFSLSLNMKEITVLLGRNGSGKTSLTKIILGILKPPIGEVWIKGTNIKELSLGQVGSIIGYVFQNPDHQIFGATVMDQLLWTADFLGQDKEYIGQKANSLLKDFDIEKLVDIYPYQLSLGEKRILTLASAMISDPDYLILDEPTSSLDPDRIRILSGYIRSIHKKGTGALIITHDKDFAMEWGDRIITIDEGKIKDDTCK